MSTLLGLATATYNSRQYDWGGPSEGPQPYDGTKDIDGNRKLDIDCSHLVHNILNIAGYDIPYLSTAQLNSPKALKYFDIIPLQHATQNDLILYPSHVGIFSNYNPSSKVGEYFGSQSRGPGCARFDEDGTWGWDMNFKILRPKKEFLIQRNPVISQAERPENRWSQLSPSHRPQRRWRLEAYPEDGMTGPYHLIRWQR